MANLPLAAYCLAAARTEFHVAKSILGELRTRISTPNDLIRDLPALLAIVRSPVADVRAEATRIVKDLLLDRRTAGTRGANLRTGGDTTALTYVLRSVAEDRSPRMLELAAVMADIVPADARAVEPLWSCLDVPGAVADRNADVVVARLLTMATTQGSFAELQQLPPLASAQFSDATRANVFPFRRGADRSSNLVTLVTWATERGLSPDAPFFRSRGEHPTAFRRVEWAQRYTLRVDANVSGGLLRALAAVAPFPAIWAIGFQQGMFGAELYVGRFGGWTPMLALVTVVLSAAATAAHAVRTHKDRHFWKKAATTIPLALLATVLYAMAFLPLSTTSIPLYAAVSTLAAYVLAVLPVLLYQSSFQVRFNIPPLNPLLTMYDDPGCRHWVATERPPREHYWRITPVVWALIAFAPVAKAIGLTNGGIMAATAVLLMCGWAFYVLRPRSRRRVPRSKRFRLTRLARDLLLGLAIIETLTLSAQLFSLPYDFWGLFR